MAPKKILLVDDSETVLLLEQLILKKEPYQLITAMNGMEGVEKALEIQLDLILMDVVMPEMNGFEAVRWLRQRDATRTVPIVMVSSLSPENAVQDFLNKGAKRFLQKPIQKEHVLATLKPVCKEAGVAL